MSNGMALLKFVCEDFWSRPVYIDQYDNIWKDVSLGVGKPALCNSSDNTIDGEPDSPIEVDYKIVTPSEKSLQKHEYMLLGRLQGDCDYYLGNGNRYPKHLWAGSEVEQISEMKRLYNQLIVKPEWITYENILNYEKEMVVG